MGSPCEMFSEASYNRPTDEEHHARWPLPLRSAERLLGLEGLSMTELLQVHMGGNFFQQALLALSYHMVVGGCYVSEHPAPPPAPLRDPERPSVWTSSLAEILLGHPDATLSHTCQYQWNDSDQTNRTAPLANAILL